MRLRIPTTSITVLDPIYDMAASLRGTGALTGLGEILNLPDVSSNLYTTILSNSYRVEDVGFIEMLSMAVTFQWYMLGNGQWRWEVSKDGGTTWVTITEVTSNTGIFTMVNRGGAGLWLPSIDVGTNKFQVRFQARAVAGTVSTQILDRASFIRLLYRKWVLS